MPVTAIAGSDADIGIALQAAQGTAAAAAQHRFLVTEGWINANPTYEDIAESTVERLRSASFLASVSASGSPAAVLRPNFLGLLLYGAMGAKAVTGAADPWTHTFTLAQLLPYLTVWSRLGPVASGGLYQKFIDCKIASLRIASAANGLMIVTPEIMGTDPRNQTAAQVAVAVEDTAGAAFIHADGKGGMTVEGSQVATIESFALTIGNGSAAQTGTDVAPYAITEGLLDITIVTTQLVENFDLWRRFVYGSASPANNAAPTRTPLEATGGVDFKFTRPGTPERSLQITAPRVEIIPGSVAPNVSGDPLKYDVTYRVRRPGSGSGLTAVLKNGQATYPAAA